MYSQNHKTVQYEDDIINLIRKLNEVVKYRDNQKTVEYEDDIMQYWSEFNVITK